MGREFKYLWVLKGNCENVILAKDAKEEIIYYEMVHVQNLNYFPGLNFNFQHVEKCFDGFVSLVEAF